MENERRTRRLSPPQIIALGFLAVIFIGGILLSLPVSSADGESLPFENALFTATSAVCVTGLVVYDTGAVYSVFGQIVIMLLIQIGGLGFMTLAATLFLIVRKRITLRDRLIMQEQYNQFQLQGLVKMTLHILALTLAIELIGAIMLAVSFIPMYGWDRGIYFSIFHSVSAFCNAGFDILGLGASLVPVNSEPIIILTISVLIILGGLGFGVLVDILKVRRFSKFSLHTKVVLVCTGLLLLSGFLLFYVAEIGNSKTLGGMSAGDGVMNAFFHSVTLRTAGYDSIGAGNLHDSSKILSVIFMFIGASPASTGGGIKTTTMFLLIMLVYTIVMNKDEVVAYKHRIPHQLVLKAIAIVIISLFVVLLSSVLLSIFEQDNPNTASYDYVDMLFESASAFGTVGVSTGMTGSLTLPSKILLMITMFIGRIGPLTLTIALSRHSSPQKSSVKYPEGRIIIG